MNVILENMKVSKYSNSTLLESALDLRPHKAI